MDAGVWSERPRIFLSLSEHMTSPRFEQVHALGTHKARAGHIRSKQSAGDPCALLCRTCFDWARWGSHNVICYNSLQCCNMDLVSFSI
jgi:hypothetical protein